MMAFTHLGGACKWWKILMISGHVIPEAQSWKNSGKHIWQVRMHLFQKWDVATSMGMHYLLTKKNLSSCGDSHLPLPRDSSSHLGDYLCGRMPHLQHFLLRVRIVRIPHLVPGIPKPPCDIFFYVFSWVTNRINSQWPLLTSLVAGPVKKDDCTLALWTGWSIEEGWVEKSLGSNFFIQFLKHFCF